MTDAFIAGFGLGVVFTVLVIHLTLWLERKMGVW